MAEKKCVVQITAIDTKIKELKAGFRVEKEGKSVFEKFVIDINKHGCLSIYNHVKTSLENPKKSECTDIEKKVVVLYTGTVEKFCGVGYMK